MHFDRALAALGALAAMAAARPAAAQSLGWRLGATHGITDCAMVFDAARQRFVALADAPTAIQTMLNVEWDGTRWLPTATPPPSRTQFGLAYDRSRARVVLFGGRGYPANSGTPDDVWEYDGANWVAIQPAVRPPGRTFPALTYDPARGGVLLTGGLRQNARSTDTWLWDGTSWRQFAATAPALDAGVAAAHPSTGRVLLIGNPSGGTTSATWTFDGSQWQQASPATSPPIAATYRAATDVANDRVVLLASESAAIWEWNGSNWSQRPTVFDGRRNCGFAFDDAGNGMIFGGSVFANAFLVQPQRDTWRLAGGGAALVASAGPGETRQPAIAYDSWRDRVVSIGQSASGVEHTQEWDGSAWRQFAAPPTPSGMGARLCFDSLRGRTVRYGGTIPGFPPVASAAQQEWDGAQWHVIASPSPGPRTYHSMTFDIGRGVVLLFGGVGLAQQRDTWQWDGSTWAQVATTGPSARTYAAFGYDPARARAVLFGGQDWTTSQNFTDTWEWDGAQWRLMTPLHSPLPRNAASLVYDPSSGAAVLLGGMNSSSPVGGTWLWNGVDWTQGTTTVPAIVNASGVGCGVATRVGGDQWLFVSTATTWVGAPIVASTRESGSGCGGSGVPVLHAHGVPVAGSSFAVELHRAAAQAPFLLAVGIGSASTVIGAGCTVYLPQIDDSRVGLAGPTGYAEVPLPVPATPALLDLEASLQAGVLDATAPLGFALSNAVVAHIGR